jgi:hypothetical protein
MAGKSLDLQPDRCHASGDAPLSGLTRFVPSCATEQMGTDDEDTWRSQAEGAGGSPNSPDAQDRRIQGLRKPQMASRFGWKLPSQPAQKAKERTEPIR